MKTHMVILRITMYLHYLLKVYTAATLYVHVHMKLTKVISLLVARTLCCLVGSLTQTRFRKPQATV